MNITSSRKNITEVQKLLEILPDIYFAVLKNTFIEEESDSLVRCTFELPLIGKRTKVAPNAIDAMREVLAEISELLTSRPEDSLQDAWHNIMSSKMVSPEHVFQPPSELREDRFQSKPRQLTIGITIPATLKSSLKEIAEIQNLSFSEVARELTSIGFDEFDKRVFSESSKKLISEFLLDIKKWNNSETEQIMLRTEPNLAIRIRTTAKEFKRSASEFGTMCMAHGLTRQLQLTSLEQKISAVRGSALRDLAPQMGLQSNVSLLSGVLAGSIKAPKKLLIRLSNYFDAPEISLITFFKLSCASRAVPAFKAENGKPQVCKLATSWEDAVKASGLPETQVQELLELNR